MASQATASPTASPTALAQRRTKTGDTSPGYRLSIGGKRFSEKLYDGTATYSADGTSEFSLSCDADLEGLEGEKVVLEVGYGDSYWEWFGGWLEESEVDHWGAPAQAIAYGPFKELGEVSLQTDTSYEAKTLGYAITDLHATSGRSIVGSGYEIMGNPSFLLSAEVAELQIGTTFSDALGQLLEAASWVSVDRPSFMRRYRPRPKPRPSSEAVATYSEAHYPPGAFKARRGKPYGSVGAFRRDEEGNFAWPPVLVGVKPLKGRQPNPYRTFWLEDFQGTEEEARSECGALAALMSEGVYTWTLEGISANPSLNMHDVIRAHATELRDEGGRFKERYETLYACAIDSEATIDVSREGMPMGLSGETAIRISGKRIPRSFSFPGGEARGTSAVVRAETTFVGTLDELSGNTLDELSGDTLGELGGL